MSSKTHFLNGELYEYLLKSSLREPQILQDLRKETVSLAYSSMQICPEQGQFMAFLAKLMGAKKALEVGVFTGYSSLAVAMALPEDGRLIACDINDEWTLIARKYWERAGISNKIDLRLAPALETLKTLENKERGTFDFAFIDADKEQYENYFTACLNLLRSGGLIAVDNVFWGGSVVDAKANDDETMALRQFNEARRKDQRIDLIMIPIGDGLTLARKK